MNTPVRLFLLLGLVLNGEAFGQSRQPNIVVIVGDEIGYGDLSFHGCKDIPTPHLDALAASGVRCSSGYVSAPVCSPTRAGLMTGRYQQRFGHENNLGPGRHGLPLSEVTLADTLRKAGYATGLVGKWHLGDAPQFHPQKRGFQEFFGFLNGAHDYFPVAADPDPILRGAEPIREETYLTDAFAREAVAFIERYKTQPFFLYVAFNGVHTPLQVPEQRLKQFGQIEDPRRRTYAAMMSALDDAIGLVTAKIKDLGLTENTLIFFFSDNGGPTTTGSSVNGSSNRPLRGSKRQLFEGGIRVPFVVSWPARLPAGSRYEQPVIQLDVFPTALSAAGVSPPELVARLDGVDLLPYLSARMTRPPHEAMFWRFETLMAIRKGDWKLVQSNPERMTKAKRLKTMLFNLSADLSEATDLSDEQPDKLRELTADLQVWSAALPRPLWGVGASATNP